MLQVQEGAAKIKAAGPSAPKVGRDPVNRPMINNWIEAMGDTNPIYVSDEAARAAGHPGIVAPPAMAQVWTMGGLHKVQATDDPLGRAMELLDGAGYESVVATNSEQIYHRYLVPGEEVSITNEVSDIFGPKQTALGESFFINIHVEWKVGDELVAEMNWRIMKFRPSAAQPTAPAYGDLDPSKLMRPSWSRDSAYFWEGVAAHELRLQKRPDGSLQHPPVPAVWQDKEAPIEYQVASGKGTVYSYVVHHAPQVPGRALPFVIALVELDEGVRMLGELRGVSADDVQIGAPVQVTYLDFPAEGDDPAWTLYAWEAVS
ncbi:MULTISPECIES: OB-fold domain-containing protein [unclassified Mycobacteroides]|uniref:bifunctional MaoC family dehydratase N-terminal/OB-fold nucleic acid binding domain-containing protein n=1 Tax=unclassified Mycobacteroides TaxID=2618759 RepID=UPI0028154576|nr:MULTISPECIES: OB-fold domain-containing protein [unclassified Mycobacteroides]